MIDVVKFSVRAWAAGVLIALAANVYLAVGRGLAGSLMFGFGLLAVVLFRLPLFTGMIGFVDDKEGLAESLLVLGNNCLGAMYGGMLCMLTSLRQVQAQVLVSNKLTMGFGDGIIRGIICGALMLIAVLPWREPARMRHNDTAKTILTIMTVAAFLMLSGEHCIAFIAFWSTAGCPDFWHGLAWFAAAVIGNAVGAWVMRKGIIN